MSTKVNTSELTTISLAEVSPSGTIDPDMNGVFKAKVRSIGNSEEFIYYVSPYASNSEGGFLAIPEPGVEILVCRPVGSQSWYYLGSTFSPEPQQSTGPVVNASESKPLSRIEPYMYRAKGAPMFYVFKGPDGGGLTIAEEQNASMFNKKVELNSPLNKTVSLIDSPDIDSIILDSGNGSKITLTSDPKRDDIPARSVEIYTVGPQKYINDESQTDVVVLKGGRELQILNEANGVEWGDAAICGNVNIQSKKKDVNIFTQADKGRIFIECLNEAGSDQVIEIQTNGIDGAIRIKTNGKVDIDAANIGINASESINMKAGGVINIEAGGNLSLKSAGTVYSDGQQIRLNEGGSQAASPNIGDSESTYGNEGVTTYS